MSRGTLTLPPWTPVHDNNASADRINRTANKSGRQSQTTQIGLGDGDWIRCIYGRVSVAPVIPTIGTTPDGRLVALCVFAANECQEIERLYIDDVDWLNTGYSLGGNVDIDVYLGNQTSPDPTLANAISGYNDVIGGYTYAVLTYPRGFVGDFSKIRAVIKGQPISAGFDNPALCMAHFAQTYMALTVEVAGLSETAARCNQIVSGEKRRTLSLPMEKRATKADWLATLAEYAGCYYYIKDNQLVMIAKKPRAVTHTVTPDHIIAATVELSRVSMASVANKINMTYTLPTNDEKSWSSEKVSAELPGIDYAHLRESNITLAGFTSASMAKRYAIERLNEQNLCDLKITFETSAPIGQSIKVGEVISVSCGLGLSNKQFVVTQNEKRDVCRNKIQAREYDGAVFSDVIVANPSTPDTNLPNPSSVSMVTGLTVNEVLKKNKTGIWHSYLEINFIGGDDHNQYDIEVYDKANLSRTIWQAYGVKQDNITTPPVTDLKDYRVNVRGVNLFSFSSNWATADITANGKITPPTDVAKIEGEELGGVVYLRWALSHDMDLRDYIIQRVPEGEDWDSYFAVDVNAVTALHDAVPSVPVGRWDFLVKARDWAGNLSINAARCAVEVDDESVASRGDVHDFDALQTTDMATIYNGCFDDHSKERKITTPPAFSWFDQPLSTYPEPLATYATTGSTAGTTVKNWDMQISGSWQGFNNVQSLSGSTVSELLISQDNNTFESHPMSARTVGQYSYLRSTTTGAMIVTNPLWQIRATAKERTETGKGASLATGDLRVYLVNKYYDYVTISVQAIGFGLEGGLEDIYLSPTDDNYIDIFVADREGNRVIAPFTFTFTGR